VSELATDPSINHLQLDKNLGETCVLGQSIFEAPAWKWPAR
jgi:hypothetical protein